MPSWPGRPGGFLRWMCETLPLFASHASLAFERYAVSAHMPDARLSLMTRTGSILASSQATSVTAEPRMNPYVRSMTMWFL